MGPEVAPSPGAPRGRARRVVAACFAVLLAVLALSRSARADGDPNLDWYTIETTHYHIHFDKHLEPIARRIATLVEGIHDRQGDALGYVPKDFTEITLNDDTDDANGSATAIPFNNIQLFVTAPDDLSVLGDYDDWYLELVTHEYTHIVHTDNISGLPAIVNAVIGKSYAPNQIQPRWILEGLAVVEESEHTSAGRIRSNLFDMWLRADVLDDRIAGIDQFSSNAYRWPQGNIWYLYGSRFLRWIIDIYGANTMRAVSADYGATTIPWGINRAIRRATGRTYVELYEGFKDHIKRQYAEQVAGVERRGLREGRRLTRHGRNVFYPHFVPRAAKKNLGGEEIVYFRDDFNTRAGVYRFSLGPREAADEELLARSDANAVSSFTPDGDLIFNDVSWFRNIYQRNDLFFLPHGERSPQGDEPWRKKITMGLRATSLDVSPDGKRIVFTINTKGTAYLEIADLTPEHTIENRRDLVRSGRFDQAYTPRWSPDGKTVAYSAWTAGGYRDIRLVDVATGTFTEITHDRALDLEPTWSSDGKYVYFSSDRSGIFNIYAWEPAQKKLHQVTNVRIGAMQPAVSEDGKTLVYVGYSTYGYDLWTMPLDPARWLPALTAIDERPDPPQEPAYVPMKMTKYNPLPTLAPHNWLFSLKPGVYGPEAVNVTLSTSDVVGLHNVSASLTIEPKQPSPNFSLNYSYDRLPADFSLSLFHQTAPRSGYVVNDKPVSYNETTNGLTTGVSYTKREDYGSHNIGMSFSVANFFGDLPSGAGLDPNSANIPTSVPRGNINVVHVGYGFSNVESGYDQPGGNARGFYTDVGVDWAGDYTGSSYTVYAIEGDFGFYVTMPWLNHVLAWRTAGAAQGGNYPRNGAYYVGGYDLGGSNVLSSITSGIFNGAFVLRGYPPGVYFGDEYLLQNVEYRFPIWFPDHGISSLPLYLRRIDGNLFVDYGGAFDSLDVKHIGFFHNGALIDSTQLHSSVGGEIWLGSTLGYALNVNFRIGYAHGFSPEAVKGGQWYFIAASAF